MADWEGVAGGQKKDGPTVAVLTGQRRTGKLPAR